jgi:RNA polymerase sigma factor (sigma-70 family)
MSHQTFQQMIHWFSGISGSQRPGTDGELLRAYATAHDESAFAELLRRHGPLVWSVCARTLPSVHDAEDAFQATFLVLARAADSIDKGDSLASWLFGVARRTAIRLRRRADRPMPQQSAPFFTDPESEIASVETCDIILEEVRSLPEKYRLPLLLCGLAGRTRSEVARQLGWKEGTVAGRLARARARLHTRLARRGIVTAGGGIALMTVPRGLRAAVLRFAAGQTATRPAITTLATEVLKSMRPLCLYRLVLVVSVCLLGVLVGGAMSQRQARPGSPTDPPPVAEKKPDAAAPSTWQERLVLRGYAGSGYAEFSPDGRTLATADGRNVLRFLDTTTWKERSSCELTKHKKGTYFPQWHPFSPDSRLFVVAWRIPPEDGKGKQRYETWLIESVTGKVRSVLEGKDPIFSPVGTLLTLSRENTLVLYDYKTEREVRTLALGHPIAWRGDRFSPDGKRLFTATTDGRGKLWDLATDKPIGTLRGYNPVWSKDGTLLATVLPSPEVKLWDAATGKERATLRGFKEPGCSVQFSTDGKRVLTNVFEAKLRDDGEFDFPEFPQPYVRKRTPLDVRLWNTATGKQIVRLPGEREHCRSGVLAPDGKSIAYLRLTDGEEFKHEAVLWDVQQGKERLVLSDEKGIDDVSFMPDGTRLLGNVGPYDKSQLHMWDARTGRVLAQIDVPGGARSFSSDGKLLVLSIALPVPGPLTKPVPTPMEVRVFQLSNKPVQSETRGDPAPLEREK